MNINWNPAYSPVYKWVRDHFAALALASGPVLAAAGVDPAVIHKVQSVSSVLGALGFLGGQYAPPAPPSNPGA